MIPEAIKRAWETRQAYRQVFNTEQGRVVLNDLIRRYIRNSPVALTPEQTHVNLGMQRLAQQLVDKAYAGDEQLREALKESYEQPER